MAINSELRQRQTGAVAVGVAGKGVYAARTEKRPRAIADEMQGGMARADKILSIEHSGMKAGRSATPTAPCPVVGA